MSDKIIEILNKDNKARELLKSYNDACKKNNATPEEYEEGKKLILMLAIKNNPDAFNVLTKDLYDGFNA